MSMRLPRTFNLAKDYIEELVSQYPCIGIHDYGSMMMRQGKIVTCAIDNIDEAQEIIETTRSNMVVKLDYKIFGIIGVADRDEPYVEIDKYDTLFVLTTEGDNLWDYNMVQKIWGGEYPSTVAISMETHDVYLLFFRDWGIELMRFAHMDDLDYDAFMDYKDENAPYNIYIGSDAMFKYISGEEGLSYLRKHIVIRFKANREITVKAEWNSDEDLFRGTLND